ncbi:hypothetical protein [Mesorhizobium sp. B2-8-9]|uniref:hypothetical protein n=1 Tax=Mesorhizobium sp. B2-8-9 TaxID=2589899 RepID=UPI00112E8D89|nr:hypothetical protein [Mesorhizobium sp. B2-8-9]TPI80435.1 hypothetical protein FJ423_12130 [Mesorhizobium sp. B2-8-9]
MLTSEAIAKAKLNTPYGTKDRFHEHDDCIRIAYEWLDAQKKIQGPTPKTRPLKHLIEQWAGRYVSQNDVEVAANMHPEIFGTYPHFNISARLIEPSPSRLVGIAEAHTQSYKSRKPELTYALKE